MSMEVLRRPVGLSCPSWGQRYGRGDAVWLCKPAQEFQSTQL